MELPVTRIEDELKEKGICATRTQGNSMRPLFRSHRDAVLLRTPDREIRKYDVVLYRAASGKYVLHRVVGRKGKLLVIRGDNTYQLEYLDVSDVLAYMFSFIRKGKHRSADSLGYRLYSRVWNFIYPVRFVYKKLRAALGKLKRKVIKNKNDDRIT